MPLIKLLADRLISQGLIKTFILKLHSTNHISVSNRYILTDMHRYVEFENIFGVIKFVYSKEGIVFCLDVFLPLRKYLK